MERFTEISKKFLMIFKNYLFFLFCLFLSFNSSANIINDQISSKYDQIFSDKLLSNSDIKSYQKIFELQESCKWKQANKNILLLKNKILMGHVLAHRYLHPNCYKSEFLELTFWLKKYNDHPQAKRIYRLAIKRMPKGYKSPNKPIKPIGIEKQKLNNYKKNTDYKTSLKLSKNQRQNYISFF